jgi:3-ketosteroid 9alpha-monooxygenase subunit A
MLEHVAARPRFPFPRYPRGWFCVGYGQDLAVGQVEPVVCFGRDLVMFRGEDEVVRVLDAHCPHLGAHLGVGGKVEGCRIRCPFHAWVFDGSDGKCVEVPYAKRIPAKAAVKTWHVREVNGMIMLWHDVDGAPPAWEIPEIPEWRERDAWTPYSFRKWRIRSHNQEMGENAVDQAHFRYVHGMSVMPIPHTIELEYPKLRMVTATKMQTPRGEVDGELEATNWGHGFSTSRFTGLIPITLVASTTPVDDEYVDLRFAFMVSLKMGPQAAAGVGNAFSAEIARQLEQDKPIWESKIYLERPVICDGDGPIARYRKWCEGFYPEWYARQAREAYERAQAG